MRRYGASRHKRETGKTALKSARKDVVRRCSVEWRALVHEICNINNIHVSNNIHTINIDVISIYIGMIGLYWSDIGIMEKKMETIGIIGFI